MQCKDLAPLFLTGLLIPQLAHADLFHYSNLLVGDRALGMGGAYAGVSDDASGTYYNPAGMAFALSSDISGSANAYYVKKSVYKKTIGDQDFVETSEGLAPSFFGGLQKLDKYWDGFTAGFSVYAPDHDLKDQDDLMLDPTSSLHTFHRTANTRASTLYAGLSGAKMITQNFSIGFGLNFVNVDELNQEFQQSAIKSTALVPKDPTRGSVLLVTSRNQRTRLISRSLEPVLGMQYVVSENWTVGVCARRPMPVSESYERKGDYSTFYRFSDFTFVNKTDVDETKSSAAAVKLLGSVNTNGAAESSGGAAPNVTKTDYALGDYPVDLRGGVAWFASSRFLWTLDVDYHSASGSKGFTDLQRMAVVNFSTGAEYYVIPTIPVRLGLFTNLDARPKVDSSSVATQSEHVDYYGTTAFVGFAQSNSQVGAGFVYQMANGKAQKIAGTTDTQTVQGYIASAVFSATHTF